MHYYGENSRFVISDSFCEPLSGVKFSAEDSLIFGKILSREFKNVAVAFSSKTELPLGLAMCAGISDSGATAFLCPDTTMPGLKYYIKNIEADCGVFITDQNSPKFYLIRKNGYPLCKNSMTSLINENFSEDNCCAGEIIEVSSVDQLYIRCMKSYFKNVGLPFTAGISCGNASIRSLWKEFFSGDNEEFVFHVSNNGNSVSAFDMQHGFISYERLILAYCIIFSNQYQEILLPNSFHFSAEKIAGDHGLSIKRFSPYENSIPKNAENQLFLSDTLFLCLKLSQEMDKLRDILVTMPKFAVVKRDITISGDESSLIGSSFTEKNSRVSLKRSGKNTLSLIVQSHNMETAAEIADYWDMKLKS